MDVKASGNGHSALVADAYGPELNLHDLTVEELRALAMEEGVNLTHGSVSNRIHQQRARARRHAVEDAREVAPYVAPKSAEAIQRSIAVLRDLWAALAGSVLGNFAPSMMLIAVCIIEGVRFAQGMTLLDPQHAGLYASAAIITFVTILWRIAQEREAGNIPERTKFSLRFALGSMLYTVGIGRNFAPRRHTFAELAVLSKGAIQWLIILVGTWGGLSFKMAELPGQTAWGDIQYIVTNTGLRDWGTYLGGFVIAVALLPATEFAVTMVYEQFREVRQGMSFRPFDASSVDTAEAEEAAEAEFLRQLILKNRAAQKTRS